VATRQFISHVLKGLPKLLWQWNIVLAPSEALSIPFDDRCLRCRDGAGHRVALALQDLFLSKEKLGDTASVQVASDDAVSSEDNVNALQLADLSRGHGQPRLMILPIVGKKEQRSVNAS
jgi:hypothetical protein